MAHMPRTACGRAAWICSEINPSTTQGGDCYDNPPQTADVLRLCDLSRHRTASDGTRPHFGRTSMRAGAPAISGHGTLQRGAERQNLSRRGRSIKALWGDTDEPQTTRVEMKKFATTIALLSLSSSTVLAHDIYSDLRDRAGHLCCSGQDCKPVQATVLPDGNYYLPSTDEIIPAEMATPSPDNRFHHCTYYQIGNEFDRGSGPVWGDTPKTRCFFAPMNSS
jgi:hypothetical protein